MQMHKYWIGYNLGYELNIKLPRFVLPCIPDNVESHIDKVIIPVHVFYTQCSYYFTFNDYDIWNRLGIEPDFIFVNKINNQILNDVCLNSPSGEYIILSDNKGENILDYLTRLTTINKTTFEQLYLIRSISRKEE